MRADLLSTFEISPCGLCCVHLLPGITWIIVIISSGRMKLSIVLRLIILRYSYLRCLFYANLYCRGGAAESGDDLCDLFHIKDSYLIHCLYKNID